MILSIVIPARNEFPNIVHTVHSIINCLDGDGFSINDWEIIIVDNGSDDNGNIFCEDCGEKEVGDAAWEIDKTKPATRGTTTYLMGRGGYYSGKIRVLYDPIFGNHSARNKGVAIAKGEYVFFSDAHMSYRPGFFKHMIRACKESGGLVHGVIAWMGAYPPHHGGLGYQYTIKLGEEIKGTWAPYCTTDKDWFYIQAQGHCSVMVNRKQFIQFGGYPKYHRTYGGGEFYTDMKWWMFGSCVVVESRAIGYHLASGRGYSYNHDDYIHNVMNIGYALGMDDWLERAYLNWCRNGRREVLDGMMAEAQKEMASDRKFIEKHRKYTFNRLLIEQPWNKLNIAKHGSSSCSLLIFENTWLDLIKGTKVEKMYEESKYQKQLAEFIDLNLSKYVYKRNTQNQEEVS